MKLLLLALLLLLPMSPSASAGPGDGPKVVHDQALAGGTVHVYGLFWIHYVGDERTSPRPQVLRTSWTTFAPTGKPRTVDVLEERLPGQAEESWKAEHRYLVAKVAASFPPARLPKVPRVR